jgi:hypothetical protein
VWALVKLPNGKPKAIIVNESKEYKDWYANDAGWYTTERIIAKNQTIIVSFKIVDVFPKKPLGI